MVQSLLSKSASIADLKRRAKCRIPRFAFDYIEEGCNSDHAVKQNRLALDNVLLKPQYMQPWQAPDLSTTLFDKTYDAPFGIAPLGLSGLIWPDASAMHARAAKKANIPFVLSTVSTISIEDAARYAEENFWFQLYPPDDVKIRQDMLQRLKAVECKHLVVTLDVPALGWRPRSIRNGLSVPPKISARNIVDSVLRPMWSLATVRHGLPQFETLTPYFKNINNMQDIAHFIRTALRGVVDADMLKHIRDEWDGVLIVKGINHVDDALTAAELGVDGIIISNHGGRQLDADSGTVSKVADIIAAVPETITVMADSGVESGVDIARFISEGAKAAFAGRAFLYGVAAHGEQGATHTIDILQGELEQLMSQLHCDRPEMLFE